MTARLGDRLRRYARPSTFFALGSAVCLASLAVLLWSDANPEWKRHQRKYRAALAKSEDPGARRLLQRYAVQVRQIPLPDLGRLDRCTTCHVAIDDPAFAKAGQPVSSHPGKLLEIHPPERFGCTVCHGGDGRATTRQEAHGLPEPSFNPMLRGDYLQGACGKCHGDDEFVAGSPLETGRRLFDHYGCRTCHRLYQAGNTAGPDLTKVGSKKYDAFFWGTEYKGKDRSVVYWLENHFKNPSAFYPSTMLNFKMSDDNARALVVYMLSLTEEPIPQSLKPARP